MAEKIVEVHTHMGSGWKVTAQVRNHHLVIDQPTATDEGANPLETFLFSLGGCISAIARMVAREERIELRGLDVHVRGEMNSAGLMGQPTDDPVGFKRIELSASIDADMTTEEKNAFLDRVCHRCPVHDNLLHPTLVEHSIA
ncbi:osmotically inducible protein C [Shewanella sp. NFH-SH190041]|uniref:OsmC family protein n=1 Tax=Shewanella sp. NFH-SH190041 TaxID=2950245 RepID=UPI0021C37D04|nr:OsmC family protein [Shewanella sp. NFH-SH190041]BDM65441.1 osmotically inducible protein C [Shewanella sp. NFH-SH190041]